MSKESPNNPRKALGRYILDVLGIIPVKCPSGKGFMLYQPHKVTDLRQLSLLVDDVPNWKLIPGFGKSPAYNPDGTKIVQQYYIGFASSERDMKDIDSFLNIQE